MSKVKILLIKRFSSEKVTLKGSWLKWSLKFKYKGVKLFIIVDK